MSESAVNSIVDLNDSLKKQLIRVICLHHSLRCSLLYAGNTGMHSNDMISDENAYEHAHSFPVPCQQLVNFVDHLLSELLLVTFLVSSQWTE